jgi:hypothetical protein
VVGPVRAHGWIVGFFQDLEDALVRPLREVVELDDHPALHGSVIRNSPNGVTPAFWHQSPSSFPPAIRRMYGPISPAPRLLVAALTVGIELAQLRLDVDGRAHATA